MQANRCAFGFAFFLSTLFLASPTFAAEPAKPELIVYAYDTLVAEGGWLKKIFPAFEKKCACTVRGIGVGDGGQLLSRLQLETERGKLAGQVAVGIDQNLWERAKKFSYDWKTWRPEGWKSLASEVRDGMGKDPSGFLPFDFGVYALIADTEQLGNQKAPESWADLKSPVWKRKLILEDPRTSTPGLAFVLGYSALHPSDFSEAMTQLKGQWLTLAPSWDQAYGLFLKKEAPLVWSYVTSQAYHREHGDQKNRYRAVVLSEGMPVQIEGAFAVAGAIKTPADEKLAKLFLNFLLSSEAQAEVAKTNWMVPALQGVKLPESFAQLPRSKKIIETDRTDAGIKAILEKWRAAL